MTLCALQQQQRQQQRRTRARLFSCPSYSSYSHSTHCRCMRACNLASHEHTAGHLLCVCACAMHRKAPLLLCVRLCTRTCTWSRRAHKPTQHSSPAAAAVVVEAEEANSFGSSVCARVCVDADELEAKARASRSASQFAKVTRSRRRVRARKHALARAYLRTHANERRPANAKSGDDDARAQTGPQLRRAFPSANQRPESHTHKHQLRSPVDALLMLINARARLWAL